MDLNINKDEAQLIKCALTYYLTQGAFPSADLDGIISQLNIIEQVEK